MSAIEWDDVVAHAPTLSTLSESAQEDILAYVMATLSISEWGGEEHPTLRLARIYLAAHNGIVSSRGGTGASGPVVFESVGNISRSYASNPNHASTSDLASTSFGRAVLALARVAPGRAGFVL